jgi:3-methyladenine DNA glycosylase AlkD
MPASQKKTAKKKARARETRLDQTGEPRVDQVIAELRRLSSKKTKDGMARYAIPSENAFGVPVGVIRALAKRLGKSHALAEELWKTGHYEARMLATFVDDPARVTPAQMDRWCKDFDSWAICDTACFALFDRTPHALAKVKAWAKSDDEFVKRAAFALLASLTVHGKEVTEAQFVRCLPLVERAAQDERNFVKKAVNWALRSLGKKSPALNVAAIAASERLAQQPGAAPRWVGKNALRELSGPSVQRRLAKLR